MAEGRLTGLDASFLHLENGGAHMHVAGVMLFDGEPPRYDDLVEMTEARLHVVPRYRQKLAFVPLGQGRPRWVDDPHLNLRYHIRRTALPRPGSEAQLRALAGRVFSQPLDRDKPLWEMWLVEGVESGPDGAPRFAMLSKTHHALVDGISGVDIMSVLFDAAPDPPEPPDDPPRWTPRPEPSSVQLLAEALLERATVPAEAVRSARAVFRGPRQVARGSWESFVGVGAMAWAGMRPPPRSPYNVDIGPHRRFAWVRASLGDVKAIKDALGGTVNDVVLATVAGGLRRHMERRGAEQVDSLRAMVPVSVRSEDERGSLGNRVAAMMAPLPVAEEDPQRRLATIAASMQGIKRSGQAVGAQVLTQLSGFAPPTLMAQGSRLVSTERFFNVVVTNVPGPQYPLYLLGRELRDAYPMVPLAKGQALGIAIMSYNGRMNFGLLGDWDAMTDLDELAADLEGSLKELADAAGVDLAGPPPATLPPATRGRVRKHVAT
jgi:diacylglycerol O-acyltransferase / wax synthase